jgi:antitoxin ParD1/3/4
MVITLTPEQEAWLKTHVSSGVFASIEEAARQLIDERIAEREIEEDDLARFKPLVDEGLAALERGEFMSLEEHKARNAARLAALRR